MLVLTKRGNDQQQWTRYKGGSVHSWLVHRKADKWISWLAINLQQTSNCKKKLRLQNQLSSNYMMEHVSENTLIPFICEFAHRLWYLKPSSVKTTNRIITESPWSIPVASRLLKQSLPGSRCNLFWTFSLGNPPFGTATVVKKTPTSTPGPMLRHPRANQQIGELDNVYVIWMVSQSPASW